MKHHIILYFGCVGIIAASCSPREVMIQESLRDFCLNDELRERIRVDSVYEQPVTQHVNLTGEITYSPDGVVRFVSLVEGVTAEAHFSLGDFVKKGAVLAAIKSPELSALLAERQGLRARAQLVDHELLAAARMYEDKLVAARDLLEARSEKERLTIQLANIESTLALFHPNEAKGTFEILAPKSGYIVDKQLNSGAPFNSGDNLFTLSDLNEIWVMVNVYATDMQFVKPGMEVGIQTLAYPGETFHGRISTLSPVFDSDERVLKARVVLENPGLRLKPGMSADIAVERRTGQQAVAIPVGAVVFDDNQYFAVVYAGDCKLQAKLISILAKDGNMYFVDGGINAGDQVVTQNHLLVYEKIKALP
ncbi:efflux RND transporter periplasmic adaptor subunit [Parapedobacter lycopersici]|uniref:efflux RND transporter periplasmic adaptor subunit n=1 Tax=Parapedobacter lycopersici TaxID=1864939 RepID=UPI00214DD6DD|nr:efflux RND transporter periplasmic adaptor subunit [Parapedobacter lycopersici]